MTATDPPGLVRQPNRDGTDRLYWRAPARARALGYEPSHVRLHPQSDAHLHSWCSRLQAEALDWLAQAEGAANYADHVETLSDLFRAYRTRPESPYRHVKANSRRAYERTLTAVERLYGDVRLADVTLSTLRSWYDAARDRDAGFDKLHKAHDLISTLRRAVDFGVAAELDECERLDRILSKTRFPAPGRRTVAMTREQCRQFIDAALTHGRASMALATAIQFETGLRQRDVIGEWLPIVPGRPVSAYVLHGRQWANGLTWADIGDDLVLTKQTTKTGSIVSHDLTLCPLTLSLLERFPEDQRFGPVVLNPHTDRPYAEFTFGEDWRVVARKAGLPDELQNRDARSGAATEADEAGGVAIEDLRIALGHSNAKTTARYIRGAGLEQSRRVAALRLAKGRKS